MLSASATVLGQFPLSQRVAIAPHRGRKRSEHYRRKKSKQNKLNYRNRKIAGLCSYGLCPKKTEPGHTHCGRHLQAMSKRAGKRREERNAQGLCTYCGERPQFWGRKCIICRQVFGENPLPRGARQALRHFREAEARRLHEQIETDARAAALQLLSSERVRGKQAEALHLYAGIDNRKWRTYKQVAAVMHLSVQRVQQLLLPSKLNLSATLSGRVPWRPLEQRESKRDGKTNTPQSTSCASCNDITLKAVDHESYRYENCGLPNVVLSGLMVDHCQGCNTETVFIPRIADLHRELARAVLRKPASMTGREFRFLRAVAGLSRVGFAEQLGVAIQTIQAWERFEVLRYLNDLGARIVITSLVALGEECSQIFGMLSAIRARRAESVRVSAHWISDERRWIVAYPTLRVASPRRS